MKSLLSVPLSELESRLALLGQPRFRAKQIQKWLFTPGVTQFEQMTNLPKPLREALSQEFTLRTMHVAAILGTEADPAEKFLLELEDGNRIEAVILHNEQGQHSNTKGQRPDTEIPTSDRFHGTWFFHLKKGTFLNQGLPAFHSENRDKTGF